MKSVRKILVEFSFPPSAQTFRIVLSVRNSTVLSFFFLVKSLSSPKHSIYFHKDYSSLSHSDLFGLGDIELNYVISKYSLHKQGWEQI